MKIKFWKMSAAGNDFILIQAKKNLSLKLKKRIAILLSQRKISIGADGVIFVRKLNGNSLKVEYFNSDGTEAFCGNGIRCAALWFHINANKTKKINLHTKRGILKAQIKSKRKISVEMPQIKKMMLNCKGKFLPGIKKVHFIDTGTRHIVIKVEDTNKVDVISKGRALRYHPYFMPEGTNVNFITLKENNIYIRTYEKGVEDETLSCGTGITAAGIISAILYGKKPPVNIISKSGAHFKVYFKKDKHSIKEISLEGPARIVFSGETYFPQTA